MMCISPILFTPKKASVTEELHSKWYLLLHQRENKANATNKIICLPIFQPQIKKYKPKTKSYPTSKMRINKRNVFSLLQCYHKGCLFTKHQVPDCTAAESHITKEHTSQN